MNKYSAIKILNQQYFGLPPMKRLILLYLIIFYTTAVLAQEESVLTEAPDTIPPSSRPIADSPFFSPGSWTVSLYGGSYDSAEESQFTGIRNEYSLGVGFSADLNHYPYLGLDFELFYVNRDYDTPVGPPLWGTIDNDTSIQSTAFLVGGRAFYPAERPFRIYASAGFGYFHTKMVVYGSTLGLPGSYEDKDMNMEFYYGAGISYLFGKWGLGLDYRHFNLEGNFSDFNISNADLGGDLFMLGLRFSF